jgi:hypothetical protein
MVMLEMSRMSSTSRVRALRVAVDDRERPVGGAVVEVALPQHPDPAHDRGEWRAKLV